MMELSYPSTNETFTPGTDEPFADAWLSKPIRNNPSPKLDLKYEFLHDKVQEACYEMIPQDELSATHLTIGRNLKEYTVQNDEFLFEVCNHVSAAENLVSEEGERREMAKLHLNAARKAMTRAAFEHALHYAQAARSLSAGDVAGEGTFKLGVGQILLQALFSLAKYDEALREAEEMMERSSSELETVVIGVERIRALRSLGRNREAYEQGMRIIKAVGLQVPDDIWDVGQVMAVALSLKKGLDTEETLKVPTARRVNAHSRHLNLCHYFRMKSYVPCNSYWSNLCRASKWSSLSLSSSSLASQSTSASTKATAVLEQSIC
jgi:hypothetical protein